MLSSETFVRAYRDGDLDAVDRIAVAAYGYPMSPPIRVRLAADHIALVAERAGAIVGFVLLADYRTVGYVGSMMVDPAVQRSGAGTALMKVLVTAAAGARLESLALDASDMGAPLYERFGFIDIDRTLVFEREAQGRATDTPGFEENAFERLVALDAELLGCDRSGALSMLARVPNVTLSLEAHGFAMTRGDVLGPWLARTPDAASALLAAAHRANPAVAKVFVPESNAAAGDIVRSAGYRHTRSLRHMVRGKPVLPRARIFGQASLGHG